MALKASEGVETGNLTWRWSACFPSTGERPNLRIRPPQAGEPSRRRRRSSERGALQPCLDPNLDGG